MKNSLKTLDVPVNESSHDRRSGKRLFLNFPIEVSGADKKGHPFVEGTKTEDISDTGCRFHTNIELEPGETIGIQTVLAEQNRSPQEKPHLFKIMWVIPEKTGWRVGVRKLQAGNIWKVAFPPRPPKTPSEPQLT